MNTYIHTYIYRHTHIKQNLDEIPLPMTMRNACDPSILQADSCLITPDNKFLILQ